MTSVPVHVMKNVCKSQVVEIAVCIFITYINSYFNDALNELLRTRNNV